MKLDKEALASATRALGNIASNDLRIYAGTAITAYLASLMENGWRIVEPGHIPMPRNLKEAQAMNLISGSWLKSALPVKTEDEADQNNISNGGK